MMYVIHRLLHNYINPPLWLV